MNESHYNVEIDKIILVVFSIIEVLHTFSCAFCHVLPKSFHHTITLFELVKTFQLYCCCFYTILCTVLIGFLFKCEIYLVSFTSYCFTSAAASIFVINDDEDCIVRIYDVITVIMAPYNSLPYKTYAIQNLHM